VTSVQEAQKSITRPMGPSVSPAARVPAWKRLGLRLKNDGTSAKKRSFDEEFRDGDSKAKRPGPVPTHPKFDQEDDRGEPQAKKRKSVSFSDDAKKDDGNPVQKLKADLQPKTLLSSLQARFILQTLRNQTEQNSEGSLRILQR
jgi:hypothetical protein